MSSKSVRQAAICRAVDAWLENPRRAATLCGTLFDPSVQDTVFVNGEPRTTTGLAVDCRGFYAASINDGAAFITLASMDMPAAGTKLPKGRTQP